MLGRAASVRELLRELRAAGVRNVRTSEFCQGRQKRWGLAWSFTDAGLEGGRVPDDPALKVMAKHKVLLLLILCSTRMLQLVPLVHNGCDKQYRCAPIMLLYKSVVDHCASCIVVVDL
jgi:RNA methyltransferase